MRIELVRVFYKANSDYMRWLGVTEEEYMNDYREGERLTKLAMETGRYEDWIAEEAHHQEMVHKYDSRLTEWEDWQKKGGAE